MQKKVKVSKTIISYWTMNLLYSECVDIRVAKRVDTLTGTRPRADTSALTEEAVRVEREIDERVKVLYGL
jgi:hypothetical protein